MRLADSHHSTAASVQYALEDINLGQTRQQRCSYCISSTDGCLLSSVLLVNIFVGWLQLGGNTCNMI